MNFNNTECPVCHHVFESSDDIVVCPECGTPHHRECWEKLSHCANGDKHASGFEWKDPAAQEQDAGRAKNTAERDSADSEKRKKIFTNPFAVIKCPVCGCDNEADANHCISCGSPLNRSRQNENDEPRIDFDRNLIPPNVLIDGIPAEETAAYIGPNSTRYILRFMDMERRDSKIGLNIAALFLKPLWFFYRKMYSWGFLLILLNIIVSVITTPAGMTEFYRDLMANAAEIGLDPNAIMAYTQAHMPSSALWQSALSYAFTAGTSIVCGLFSDYLYKRKVKSSILSIREKASSMPEYMTMLTQKGNVSIFMSTLYIFIYIMVQPMIVAGITVLFGI